MSSPDSALVEGERVAAVTGGFTLFPDDSDDQLSSEEEDHGNGLPSDGKDALQIEAALEALNNPRTSTSPITHGTPGEKKDNNGRAMSPDDGRKRTQYFEDQFAYKDGHAGSARERVQKDSPVIAELRTNVIVRILRLHLDVNLPNKASAGQRRIHSSNRHVIPPQHALLPSRKRHHDKYRPQRLFTPRWILRASLSSHHLGSLVSNAANNQQEERRSYPIFHG